jgi:hypothetical protein
MESEEIKAARAKHRLMDEKAFALTEEERMHICDMGFYNDVIRGYLIRAMENVGFEKKDISRALRGLHHAFDDMDATRAEELYLKSIMYP